VAELGFYLEGEITLLLEEIGFYLAVDNEFAKHFGKKVLINNTQAIVLCKFTRFGFDINLVHNDFTIGIDLETVKNDSLEMISKILSNLEHILNLARQKNTSLALPKRGIFLYSFEAFILKNNSIEIDMSNF